MLFLPVPGKADCKKKGKKQNALNVLTDAKCVKNCWIILNSISLWHITYGLKVKY